MAEDSRITQRSENEAFSHKIRKTKSIGKILDIDKKLRNLPPSKGSDGETLRRRTIELIRQNVNTSKQISERIGLSKRRVNEILLSLFKEGIVNRVRNNRNESFVYFLTSESTKGES
jgi:DNA-binding CsgD family transcriptional regulator